MAARVIISLALICLILTSCDNFGNKTDAQIEKYLEPSSSIHKEKLLATLLKDTVKVNENAKALVSLLDPKFDDKQSQIIVFIEMEDSALYKLEKDFSKLYNLPIAGFYNFNIDTINKAPKHYRKQYSTYIGKSFQQVGYNKLRFMVVEFTGKDPTKDLKFDKSQIWSAIMELDVFVIPKIENGKNQLETKAQLIQ
ncbi:hypothetical protein [Nonlabens antarcticus]|uniref:hypothetical protein n=1 Tax=Nonlabens antarcticus TaxID=392714 RepID=UPI0018913CAD|nr:hypothetical protein [Nonlabens antarcticus]